MRTPDLSKAMELFTSVMYEKRQMADKERQTVEKLNRALKRAGYHITHAKAEAMRKWTGRPRGARNKSIKHDLHEVGHKRHNNGVGKRGPRRPKLKRVA